VTHVVTRIGVIREAVAAARRAGRTIGLVPTMGALHDGHARLVEQCRAEVGDGLVVVSIFVNPTQFGPTEDFDRYPRTPEADHARCEAAGADLVFEPTARAMYPRSLAASTFVEVPGLSHVLEGASRPGHFRGVATVVLKLLAITQPDIAFFGAKDYQQQAVIRRLVADLDLPVTIRTAPTVREPDGLAMSSRNRYLDPDQRRAATVLFRALGRARSAVLAGERDANRVRQVLRETVESEVAAALDYAEVADAESLEPVVEIGPGRRAVGLLAVRIGTTRLIDNAILTE
jgi:pantoate--beta-alanine ligase